jgi:hypothetical protein
MLEVAVSGGASLLRKNLLAPVEVDPSGFAAFAKLTDGFRLGFRMALNTYRFFGHEVGYAYNRTKIQLSPQQEAGMAIHQGFYNFLVYPIPEGAPVRPFVTGGGHFANFVPPGASATSGGGDLKFGVNYGGGIKARVSRRFMIRLDFRQYHTPKPDFFVVAPEGWIRQMEVSAGFGIAI